MTEVAALWLTGGSVDSMDVLDRGTIHVPGDTECGGAWLHPVSQNSVQFKAYDLFISGMFHLLFLDHGWQWVTETVEGKPQIRGALPRVHAETSSATSSPLRWNTWGPCFYFRRVLAGQAPSQLQAIWWEMLRAQIISYSRNNGTLHLNSNSQFQSLLTDANLWYLGGCYGIWPGKDGARRGRPASKRAGWQVLRGTRVWVTRHWVPCSSLLEWPANGPS